MPHSRIIALLSSLLIPTCTLALQVTPNSPCASSCLDPGRTDVSAADASNTKNGDIICDDESYRKLAAGQKWTTCMSCLETSNFTQGAENDQMWFLYNMRYALSYCVFAFPNATGVGGTPCITSTACGPLQAGLENGILSPSNMTEFGYCDENGGAMTGPNLNKCLACLSAGGETYYTANYLVGLEAGCLQRPVAGSVVSMNGSVFSTSIIGVVDPSTTSASDSGNPPLATSSIAIIVVVILVLLLCASGWLCIQIRRRRREALYRDDRPANGPHRYSLYNGGGWPRPQSNLSFQCQTQVMSPKLYGGTPKFGPMPKDMDAQHMSNGYYVSDERPADWQAHNAAAPYHGISPVEEEYDMPPDASEKGDLKQGTRPGRRNSPTIPLHSIKTSIPAAPPNVHSAVSRASPSSTFTTPTSTTSTRSTTALLSNMSPAGDYGVGSPTSTRGVPPAPPPKSPRHMRKMPSRESGSPTAFQQIQVTFPGPPTSSKR